MLFQIKCRSHWIVVFFTNKPIPQHYWIPKNNELTNHYKVLSRHMILCVLVRFCGHFKSFRVFPKALARLIVCSGVYTVTRIRLEIDYCYGLNKKKKLSGYLRPKDIKSHSSLISKLLIFVAWIKKKTTRKWIKQTTSKISSNSTKTHPHLARIGRFRLLHKIKHWFILMNKL